MKRGSKRIIKSYFGMDGSRFTWKAGSAWAGDEMDLVSHGKSLCKETLGVLNIVYISQISDSFFLNFIFDS